MSHSPYAYSKWSNGDGQENAGTAKTLNVFYVPVGANTKGVPHPAKFPVPLAVHLIKTFCPPGGTVLDPFAGSGSTCIAAKKLGHDYYGFDIMPEYCKIARKRLAATIRDENVSEAG